MTGPEPTPTRPQSAGESGDSEGGVADALRSAVERTMRATAGSASTSRERAAELVDEAVRRGRAPRDELARRGQEAATGLARRGQEATGEVGKRLEVLEKRLAELEQRLASEAQDETITEPRSAPQSNPKAES